jgi:hypothetical protein
MKNPINHLEMNRGPADNKNRKTDADAVEALSATLLDKS